MNNNVLSIPLRRTDSLRQPSNRSSHDQQDIIRSYNTLDAIKHKAYTEEGKVPIGDKHIIDDGLDNILCYQVGENLRKHE